MINNKPKKHSFKVSFEGDGVKVVDCKTCGYKHLFPLPTEKELEIYYKTHYEESTPSPNFEDKKDAIEKYFLKKRNKKRILDIGSWDGDFLKLFSPKNWERVGIEPSKQKAAIARKKGIEVLEEVLEKIDFRKIGKFNVVNLNFILEHLPDPKAILKLVFDKILLTGGMVCVEVPNEFNPLQKAATKSLGLKPWWIKYPDHINYFDFNSMERLLRSVGFKIIARETSFPMEFFLLMGDSYVGTSKLGKICHNRRLELEKNLAKSNMNDFKRDLYRLLPEINIGRSVIYYAVKSK